MSELKGKQKCVHVKERDVDFLLHIDGQLKYRPHVTDFDLM